MPQTGKIGEAQVKQLGAIAFGEIKHCLGIGFGVCHSRSSPLSVRAPSGHGRCQAGEWNTDLRLKWLLPMCKLRVVRGARMCDDTSSTHTLMMRTIVTGWHGRKLIVFM